MKKTGSEKCIYTPSCTSLEENEEKQIGAHSVIDNKSGSTGVEAL